MNINNIIFKTYLTKCDAKPFHDVFEGFFFYLICLDGRNSRFTCVYHYQ